MRIFEFVILFCFLGQVSSKDIKNYYTNETKLDLEEFKAIYRGLLNMDHRNKKERKKTQELKRVLSQKETSGLLEPESSLKTRENKAGIFQVYDKFCERKHGLMGYESMTKFLENFQRQKKVDCSGEDKDENYKKDNVENDDKKQEAVHSVMRVSFFKSFTN